MTDKVLEQLITFEIINRKDMEVYRFGLEVLFLKCFHYISYLVIAFLGGEIICFLLFFVAFSLLRKNAGGYHSETRRGCYIISCLTVVLVVILPKWVELKGAMIIGAIVLLIASDMLIIGLAPLGNKNRELDNEEKKYFRKKSVFILVLENILLILLLIMNINEFALPIVAAVVCQAVLLMIQKLGKKD